VLPLVHRKRNVDRLMQLDDRDARDAFYRDVWDNRRWRALFTVFFGRAVMARLGRDPAFFRYVERKQVGHAFLDRARKALVETKLRDNHFLQYALLGEYPDLERGPLYLRESQFENLRAATSRLRIVRGDLETFLATMATGAASAFYLSDLFEWVAPAHHAAMLRAIARVARPQSRLVYWNLLVPRARPAELADRIAVHDDEARALHARDLAFVYDSFHVESIR
jgi:S-adenosylmethionine-diacylglycerol 3-amino-3-carboxypropyl transferase